LNFSKYQYGANRRYPTLAPPRRIVGLLVKTMPAPVSESDKVVLALGAGRIFDRAQDDGGVAGICAGCCCGEWDYGDKCCKVVE
jgi:hypothetical protein